MDRLQFSIIVVTIAILPIFCTSVTSIQRNDLGHLEAEFEHNRIVLPISYPSQETKTSLAERRLFRQRQVSKVPPTPSQQSLIAVETNEVSNYDFEYQIHGGGNFYGHAERRSGSETSGEYFVILPDLRRQVVKYYVDGSGYHATVTYEPITAQDATILNLITEQPRPSIILNTATGDTSSTNRRRSYKKVVRKRVPKKRQSNPSK